MCRYSMYIRSLQMFHCKSQGVNACSIYIKEHIQFSQTIGFLTYWKTSGLSKLDAWVLLKFHRIGVPNNSSVLQQNQHCTIVTGEMESLQLFGCPLAPLQGSTLPRDTFSCPLIAPRAPVKLRADLQLCLGAVSWHVLSPPVVICWLGFT